MQECPLIIIVFDGLMGEFKLSSDNEVQLYLRLGLVQGLQALSKSY